MSSFAEVQESLDSFFSRVKHETDVPKVTWHPISEVRDRNFVKGLSWAKSPGVYMFALNDEIKWVGRALDSTRLINRVRQQVKAWGNQKWDDIIGDSKTLVGVLPLEGENALWIPSLEVYLIETLHPPINMRR